MCKIYIYIFLINPRRRKRRPKLQFCKAKQGRPIVPLEPSCSNKRVKADMYTSSRKYLRDCFRGNRPSEERSFFSSRDIQMTSTVRLRIPSKLGFCYTMDDSALDILSRIARMEIFIGSRERKGRRIVRILSSRKGVSFEKVYWGEIFLI